MAAAQHHAVRTVRDWCTATSVVVQLASCKDAHNRHMIPENILCRNAGNSALYREPTAR
jgi:hypothetical protein